MGLLRRVLILSLSLRGPPPVGVGVVAESRQWQSRHHPHLHHRTRFHQPPLRRWKIGGFLLCIKHSQLNVMFGIQPVVAAAMVVVMVVNRVKAGPAPH